MRPARRSAACRCTRTRCSRRSSRKKQEARIEGLCRRQRAARGRGPAGKQHRAARRAAMKAFSYVNPASEKEAVAALKIDGIAAPIGGGQDLLARMKDYIDSPDRLVNVKGLDAAITAMPGGGMKIGAAGKNNDLYEHAPGAEGESPGQRGGV